MLNRNDICWCGSGKKYKKCHMDFDKNLEKYEKQGFEIPERRLLLNEEDIEGLRKSSVITKGILEGVADLIKPGVTTNEIDKFVHDYTIERGGTPATLGYHGFPKSCCTSINEVICHGIPEDRPLKEGDIINVDVTTILDGYFSDASRMYLVGQVSERAKDLVQCAKDCLQIGLDQVKPYGSISDIGLAIEAYATSKGYTVVRDFGGHGIGKNFHEDPHVSHFDTGQKGMLMVPGMVFTIEPMINEGTYKLNILEDDWTAVTRDGKLSAQWEHTLVVTEEGYEILV
ncbi:methionyl aminopeptidase [Acidaminobacter sp. JC074]|uniref:methionyl aminopeptidase n=1 Tax=Acidaminobacter sp. JC074 TaxID=2530199 RepID=UPI001F0D91EF|nr:methionyl aminopeptidase [Acidaminobacter sp. JC074]MCH4887963.1 methionyl aminopeptidase [Acidaminobacter sp. JC074]